MTAGNKSGFVATIMFTRIDEVHGDFLEIFGRYPIGTFVQESVVVINLCKFKLGAVLPLGIAILLVKFHGLFVVLGYENTVHVNVLSMPGMELGLVGMT